MERRRFLQNMSAGAAAALLLNPVDLLAAGKNRKLKHIGYISGLIGKELEADWKGTLKKTADMGYTEIEIGKYLGDSAKDFLAYCKAIGLKPIVGGFGFSEDMDKVKTSLDKLVELKLKYAVNYWPWRVGPPFNLDECQFTADWLNEVAPLVKERGMEFCFHNHNNEFIPMEKGLPFDYIMENTDPDLVKCELDIHWVYRGGSDPIEVMKQYPGRICILHVKDIAFDVDPEDSFRCPGEGDIDWPAVFATAHNQKIKHFFVERDKHPDGMSCLQTSADYLLNLRY